MTRVATPAGNDVYVGWRVADGRRQLRALVGEALYFSEIVRNAELTAAKPLTWRPAASLTLQRALDRPAGLGRGAAAITGVAGEHRMPQNSVRWSIPRRSRWTAGSSPFPARYRNARRQRLNGAICAQAFVSAGGGAIAQCVLRNAYG
jgi:hypothetical protein